MPQVGIEEFFNSPEWDSDTISTGVINEATRRTRADLTAFVMEQICMAFQVEAAAALEANDVERFTKAYDQLSPEEQNGVASYVQEEVSRETLTWLYEHHRSLAIKVARVIVKPFDVTY